MKDYLTEEEYHRLFLGEESPHWTFWLRYRLKGTLKNQTIRSKSRHEENYTTGIYMISESHKFTYLRGYNSPHNEELGRGKHRLRKAIFLGDLKTIYSFVIPWPIIRFINAPPSMIASFPPAHIYNILRWVSIKPSIHLMFEKPLWLVGNASWYKSIYRIMSYIDLGNGSTLPRLDSTCVLYLFQF